MMKNFIFSLLIATSFVTYPINGMEQTTSTTTTLPLQAHHPKNATACCTDFFKAIRENNPRALLEIAQQRKIDIEAKNPDTGLTPLLTAIQHDVLEKAIVQSQAFKEKAGLTLHPSLQVISILLMLEANPYAAWLRCTETHQNAVLEDLSSQFKKIRNLSFDEPKEIVTPEKKALELLKQAKEGWDLYEGQYASGVVTQRLFEQIVATQQRVPQQLNFDVNDLALAMRTQYIRIPAFADMTNLTHTTLATGPTQRASTTATTTTTTTTSSVREMSASSNSRSAEQYTLFDAIHDVNLDLIIRLAHSPKFNIETRETANQTDVTPLMTAALLGNLQTIHILLMLGASPLATMHKTSGFTVLKAVTEAQKQTNPHERTPSLLKNQRFVIEILTEAEKAWVQGTQNGFIQYLFGLVKAQQQKLPFDINDLKSAIEKQTQTRAQTTRPSRVPANLPTSLSALLPATTTTTITTQPTSNNHQPVSTPSLPMAPTTTLAQPSITTTTFSTSTPACPPSYFNPILLEGNALFEAIRGQRLVPILSLAYSKEFNIEIREDGKTPLMAAAIHGNMHVLSILLMLRANPLATGHFSFTALDLAEAAHNAVAVGLLTEALQAWRNHTQNAFIAKLFSQAEAEHLAVPMDVLEEMIAQQKTKVTELH